MPDQSGNAGLAAAAGVDPWKLRDDLASGDPGAIGQMAAGWNTAADNAADASAQGESGSETTGAGATADGAPMHDAETAAQQTAQQLGIGGEEMRHVSRVLTQVADELTTQTAAAEQTVTELEAELAQVQAEFDAYMAANAAQMDPATVQQSQANLQAEKIKLVEAAGRLVQAQVDTYEQTLNQAQGSLGELGIGLDTDGDGEADTPGAEVTLGATAEDGEAFAGARIQDSTTGELGPVDLAGEYDAWAGARAGAGAADNGLGGEADAQAGALAGTEGSADLGPLGVTGGAEAFVGAEANAEAGFGMDGVNVGAGAFAGARAGVEGGGEIFGAGGTVEAEARFGIGAEASFNAGIDDDGTWRLGGEAGVALGPGVKLGGEISFNPKEFIEDVGEILNPEPDGPPPEDVGLDILDD